MIDTGIDVFKKKRYSDQEIMLRYDILKLLLQYRDIPLETVLSVVDKVFEHITLKK